MQAPRRVICLVLTISLLPLSSAALAEGPNRLSRQGDLRADGAANGINPHATALAMASPSSRPSPSSNITVDSDKTLLAKKNGKAVPEPVPVKPAAEPVESKLPLSKTALDVARDIDVLPMLERLATLKQKYLDKPGEGEHVDMLACRQELLEIVLNAFLEMRDSVASIDAEISQTDALADFLEAKRDKAIRYNNIANFSSQGGFAMLASGMQTGTGNNNAIQNAGNELEVIAGFVQTAVSSYAIKQQNGKRQSAVRKPNMLAPILGREPADYVKYSPSIWSYLNQAPPGSPDTITRRQLLVTHWVSLGRIMPLNKSGSPKQLDQISGTIPLDKTVSIDLLRTRIPMLEDTRSSISTLSKSLREIMTFVRAR